ncbi:7239_t:CDS:2 [Entrophospora sp. SA101]|nr:7239_t:CDS:2 [Entrophospora sp. SA101]
MSDVVQDNYSNVRTFSSISSSTGVSDKIICSSVTIPTLTSALTIEIILLLLESILDRSYKIKYGK